MPERLDSNAELDDLFDTVFGEVHQSASLALDAQDSEDPILLAKRTLIALMAQSQVLLAMYSEMAAARRERRGDQTSSRPKNGRST
jgi:hypothetical protein